MGGIQCVSDGSLCVCAWMFVYVCLDVYMCVCA